jgi:hypothetical protein
VATLNAGQRHQQLIDGQSEIQSSNPILIAQYSNGSSFDGVTSDPFEMHIPPFEQFQTGYTVTTPASGFRLNFINVIAPNSAVGAIKLDGTAIPASDFTPIGTSGFSGAQIDVSLGTHSLTGDGQPFGAFVYGFDSFDSYGYAGGLSLAPIATVRGIALTPASATRPPGTQHCVTAAVTDANGVAVPGVRVDFTVTGVNPLGGNAVADNNGHAVLCYIGSNLGDDSITAVVGRVSSAPASVTWAVPVAAAAGQPERLVGLRIGHRALVALRNNQIVVKLRCQGDAGQRCIGSLTIAATSRGSRLGGAGASSNPRFNVAAGKIGRINVKPSRALLEKLKPRGKAIGQVRVRLQRADGTVTVRRLITIQTVDSRKAKNKK